MDYNNKLKLAKEALDSGSYDKETIEYIFPELKESEDEKIRKEMIFYFAEEIPQCSIQEHSDKMREFISWLKRQEVERTKLELKAGNSYFCYKSRWERADSETFKKGLIYKCNKDGVLDNFVIKNPEQHFIEIKDERIAWLEKQGKQKPTEFDDTNAKRMFIKALERVEEQNNKGYKLTDCDKNSWWEDFKAYISCTVEQKPAWSEEDEESCKRIIDLLYCTNSSLLSSIEKSIGWLKSLRPQKQWKPSEGQLECLSYAIDKAEKDYTPLTNNRIYLTLKALKEQLEKL